MWVHKRIKKFPEQNKYEIKINIHEPHEQKMILTICLLSTCKGEYIVEELSILLLLSGINPIYPY